MEKKVKSDNPVGIEVVDPTVEVISVGPQGSVEDALRVIEQAGRTCYKSEDKIGPGTSEEFYKKIIKNGHTSVLEHASVVASIVDSAEFEDYMDLCFKNPQQVALDSYEAGSKLGLGGVSWRGGGGSKAFSVLVANYRGLYLNRDSMLDELLPTFISEAYTPPSWPKVGARELILWSKENDVIGRKLARLLRVSVRVVCDRGTSHELVRHRVMSFSQESTRYVKYGKDPMEFLMPSELAPKNPLNPKKKELDLIQVWTDSVESAAKDYNKLIKLGEPPQIARSVLPNSLKTELVITGTLEMWTHFLYLRLPKYAHPDARVIADKVQSSLRDSLSSRGLDDEWINIHLLIK